MKRYELWATFHGKPTRIFRNLSDERAAHWIVRFRQGDPYHEYWLEGF